AAMELRDDVEHQCPTDAVEGETLPELGHEQHPQRRGMAHDLRELWNRGFCSWRVRGIAHASVSRNTFRFIDSAAYTLQAGAILRRRRTLPSAWPRSAALPSGTAAAGI